MVFKVMYTSRVYFFIRLFLVDCLREMSRKTHIDRHTGFLHCSGAFLKPRFKYPRDKPTLGRILILYIDGL